MRLLLDTHALIWFAESSQRLGLPARNAIADPRNSATFSMVSIWEIAIKHAKGKLPGNARTLYEGLLQYRFETVLIELDHILATRELPMHHGDPFDRLLIAQARLEGMTIVTHDDSFRPYGVPILWT